MIDAAYWREMHAHAAAGRLSRPVRELAQLELAIAISSTLVAISHGWSERAYHFACTAASCARELAGEHVQSKGASA